MFRSETIPLPLRAGITARLARSLVEALSRRRERQTLARLDAHLLRDIGLTPDQARTECAKPFWRD